MQEVLEKIIEKLEEMIHPKQLYFCKYARGGCKHLDNDDKDCMECVVENAIEIVKQVGVSDDVCEWKDKELYGYYTSCTEFRSCIACKDKYWKYCPYCGKKIKVVEQNDNQTISKTIRAEICEL